MGASRTYRVTIRGKFVELSARARGRLAAEAGEHGVLSARYTAEGTVTYGPELHGLAFRFETRLDEDVEDPQLAAEAEGAGALQAWAERYGVTVTADHIDVTCMDDIKIRRPSGRRSRVAGDAAGRSTRG
ncbi:hypothetical protein DSC45_32345 [Streptomyces sp. YIM 130001]|uniref:DUF6204 family protein n=1 Tax=Streptomyces sp. YIM 130001 TaxID=2259644 RepID=UPI000E655486|nr:DUF6204 family protein [Streptomyces sp. YIM 130001]RII09217.1 hypothetical protein DSC45_32345 [Streptomyces sp. YIM 130001]